MILQLSNILPSTELLSELTWSWLIIAVPVAVCLCFINAPYGRYNSGI